MTMSSASPFENRGNNAINLDAQHLQQPNEYSLTDATSNLSLSPPTMVSEKKRRGNKSTKNHKELVNLHRSSPFKVQRVQNRRNIPAFLNKLFNMVDDQSTANLIRWSLNGDSFLVESHEEFAQTVLPRFFKHNTFSSFVRQLNMYDFHKVPVIQQDDSKKEIWEFKHIHFQRGRPELLSSVIRKRNKDKDQPPNEQIDLPTLMNDVSAIKERQTEIMASLHSLRTDNERIWKEAVELRNKYKKQQDITIKVLQFLSLQFRGHHTHLESALLELQNSIGSQEIEEHVEGYNMLKHGLVIETPSTSIKELTDSKTPSILITENEDQRHRIMDPIYINQEHEIYSNMLDSASKTAHNITQNMDQLWTNVESLASQIWLDLPASDRKDKYNSDILRAPPKSRPSDDHSFMTPVCDDGDKMDPSRAHHFMNIPQVPPTMSTGNSNIMLDDAFKKDEQRYKKNTQNKLFFINHRPNTVFYK